MTIVAPFLRLSTDFKTTSNDGMPSNSCLNPKCKIQTTLGRGPGLVVMGIDSRSEGCGFESQHRILNGRCHIIFLKMTKNKRKKG